MTYFTQTGKLMTPSDYDKLCICMSYLKQPLQKLYEETFKNTVDKPKLNYKKKCCTKEGKRKQK